MNQTIFLALFVLSLATAGDFSVNIPLDPSAVMIEQMGNYTTVNLPATASVDRIGAPNLPVIKTLISIPAGTRATKIEVVNISYTSLRGRYTVIPATEPVPISLINETDISLPVPDPSIYSSSVTFPASAVELQMSSMLLGYPVVSVAVYPVRWNPASGTIELMESIEIKVTTEETTDNYTVRTRSAQGEARTRAVVERTVINPDMVQASGAVIIPSRELKYGEYVVIATPEYESYAQEFADWKTRKGIPASVYTTVWIQSQYSCIDMLQEIRAFLTDCRDNGVEYVLIWGDDDVIAGRDVRVHFTGQKEITEFPPVDLYWSDINETTPGNDPWDSNKNGIWGEWLVDDIDYFPDMFTGRASVNTLGEAAIFIEKVLAYEQINTTDYFETAPVETRIGYSTGLLWGDVSPPCYGAPGADIISDMLPSKIWEEEKCYEYTDNNSYQITIDMINAGPAHVYHSSHGGKTSMWTAYKDSYYVSDIMAQTNISSGHLPAIWNTIACLTGHFDDKECCADAWLNSPNGGGFGSFNARYGWGNPYSPGNGSSEVLVQGLYETHWIDGQQTLGAMNSIGRTVNLFPREREVSDWCVKVYNLFGDPELPLWTEEALKLSADYPSSISGTSNVNIKVTADGSPVSDARVCIWKGDDWATADIYEVATTDASGQAALWANPTTTGDMLITVWAYNHISFLGSIRVTGTGIEEAVYETAIQTPYPNPAVNSATLSFALANAGTATIQIFDLSGRTVAVPASRDFAAGQHTLNWDLTTSDGTSVPNGFYSVVITTYGTVMTERIMVLR